VVLDPMDFRLLGALEVEDEGRPVALGSRKQRLLLALLLLHANEVVSRDFLTEQLWGEEPPPTAAMPRSCDRLWARTTVGAG
jgi:DNA-binding SARP family transcriptional activator